MRLVLPVLVLAGTVTACQSRGSIPASVAQPVIDTPETPSEPATAIAPAPPVAAPPKREPAAVTPQPAAAPPPDPSPQPDPAPPDPAVEPEVDVIRQAPVEVRAQPVFPDPKPNGPTTLGRLVDKALIETSGLAVSLHEDRLLWAINDSGQAPVLHTIDLSGRSHGNWEVDAKNRDWEDLDSGYINGVPTLIIADTGDNKQRREASRLWLVTEPEVAAGPTDTPLAARKLRFSFESGQRDVESIAIADNALWLISKEPLEANTRSPARIYRLDLQRATSAPEATHVAEYLGDLVLPRRDLAARLAAALVGVDLDQPTAFDIDEQRGVAWILTYQTVQRFDRQGNEPWSTTLTRQPDARYWHGLRQAEALAVTSSGLVVYTSEGVGAPLLALPPEWR